MPEENVQQTPEHELSTQERGGILDSSRSAPAVPFIFDSVQENINSYTPKVVRIESGDNIDIKRDVQVIDKERHVTFFNAKDGGKLNELGIKSLSKFLGIHTRVFDDAPEEDLLVLMKDLLDKYAPFSVLAAEDPEGNLIYRGFQKNSDSQILDRDLFDQINKDDMVRAYGGGLGARNFYMSFVGSEGLNFKVDDREYKFGYTISTSEVMEGSLLVYPKVSHLDCFNVALLSLRPSIRFPFAKPNQNLGPGAVLDKIKTLHDDMSGLQKKIKEKLSVLKEKAGHSQIQDFLTRKTSISKGLLKQAALQLPENSSLLDYVDFLSNRAQLLWGSSQFGQEKALGAIFDLVLD